MKSTHVKSLSFTIYATLFLVTQVTGLLLSLVICFIGTTLLGKYITLKFKWNIVKRHYHFLIGLSAAGILSIIPFVNVLAGIFLCALGWGRFLSFLFNRNLVHPDK